MTFDDKQAALEYFGERATRICGALLDAMQALDQAIDAADRAAILEQSAKVAQYGRQLVDVLNHIVQIEGPDH